MRTAIDKAGTKIDSLIKKISGLVPGLAGIPSGLRWATFGALILGTIAIYAAFFPEAAETTENGERMPPLSLSEHWHQGWGPGLLAFGLLCLFFAHGVVRARPWLAPMVVTLAWGIVVSDLLFPDDRGIDVRLLIRLLPAVVQAVVATRYFYWNDEVTEYFRKRAPFPKSTSSLRLDP